MSLNILSLGWGVQSWTLAAMSALGELPKLDAAISADTRWEHTATYEFLSTWTRWLEEHDIKCYLVSSDNTDNLAQIPVFSSGANGGQLRRQCTRDWKIRPIKAKARELLAARALDRRPGVIKQWLGISLDEWERMKDSGVKYIDNVYPLIDLKMTRADCAAWLEKNNLPVPPKSSCVFCPYKSRRNWEALKRAGGPDYATAIRVDAEVRAMAPPSTVYLHRDLKPLDEAIVIPEDYNAKQLEMFALYDDADAECDSGYCWT